MWLDEYMVLAQPMFGANLEIRKNIQARLFKTGTNSTTAVAPLAPLVQTFNAAVDALGHKHQLILFSDLPEIHLSSTPPNLWVTLQLQFQVAHMGVPMVLSMTYLDEKRFFEIADPSADYISIEVLPKIRLEFHNGTLCGVYRFFVCICAENEVTVEDTTLPLLLLPFVPQSTKDEDVEESVEWLMAVANGMDEIMETFRVESKKKMQRPTSDLISPNMPNGSQHTLLIQPAPASSPISSFSYQHPLILNHAPAIV